MSAAVRQTLAEAASSVEGITGHPYFVPSVEPGHAVVRLVRVSYPDPFGGVGFWSVDVVLPESLDDAERFAEQHLTALYDALSPHFVITEAVFGRLTFPGVGDLPTLFIQGHREEN